MLLRGSIILNIIFPVYSEVICKLTSKTGLNIIYYTSHLFIVYDGTISETFPETSSITEYQLSTINKKLSEHGETISKNPFYARSFVNILKLRFYDF